MTKPKPSEAWPESWKEAYRYDSEEIFGDHQVLGYAYAYAHRRRRTFDLVEAAVSPGGSILDVAAAQGNFSLGLAEKGYEVTWNDLRDELIDYVKLKHDRGRLEFAPGNVFDLGFKQEFDAVLITEIIEHVAHPDEFLKQVASLVRPGGVIVMTTPNGAYWGNSLPKFSEHHDPQSFEAKQFQPNGDGHIFLLWPDEIESLGQKAGLALERMDVFTTPLTNGHLKTKHLLRFLPRSWVFGLEKVASLLPEVLKKRVMLQTAALYKKL
jgi:2-polyprenyl-6-hydroxyphenyl methylase/3-demethylubiquinone-9 3-methyltransferase